MNDAGDTMKDIIEWLIQCEDRAFSAYSKAADYFHSDEELSRIIRQLADDEKMHHNIILRAYDIIKEKTDLPPLIAVMSENTRLNFENYLSELEKGMKTGTMTRSGIVDYIISLEFCEWNDIFAYIVNTLKHNNMEFKTVAVNMHRHRKVIERFIKSHTEFSKHLDRISLIPETWEEKILIVDDEQVITDVIEAILSNEGMIETAANGRIALEKVREKYYAAIISDVNMPLMDGIDFYKKAVELYPSINKRFLFFSGRLDEKTSNFLNQNGLRYLQKPSRIQDIKNTVIEILFGG